MDLSLAIYVTAGIIIVSFVIWVLVYELKLKAEVIDKVGFIEEWIGIHFEKAKGEILIASGAPCTEVMNKSRQIIRETLIKNPDLKRKMIAGSKLSLMQEAPGLCEILADSEFEQRIDMREMDPVLFQHQHFIIIDGKHLLVSDISKDNVSVAVFSLKNSKKEAGKFKERFANLWGQLKPLDLKILCN